MDNNRDIALKIIMQQDEKGQVKGLIRDVLTRYDYLPPRDKAFIKRLAEGVMERRITLDYVINKYARLPVEKQKPLIRSVLRMSTYQILFMDQVPDSAAVNEGVKLVSGHGFSSLRGFVNGVLRNISRTGRDVEFPPLRGVSREDSIRALSVRYSMPEAVCRIFEKEYGTDKTAEIFGAFLEPRPVTIRLDERLGREEMDDLIGRMRSEGGEDLQIRRHPVLSYAYELFHTDNIRFLPGYDEGSWIVQDVSSMLVAEAAMLKRGDIVIDVCSAPGGKALHAAAKLAAMDWGAEAVLADSKTARGHVYMNDISEQKVDIISENLYRMGLEDMASVRVHDATVHDSDCENSCDVLLCDLPCSGLGIMGRKPDIRYQVSEDNISSLTAIQKDIIANVWNYLKVGGTMIYSTCTLDPEENEKMLDYICENYPFERVAIEGDAFKAFAGEKSLKEGYLKLLPGEYDTDGFFLARLRRVR
ncbi:16S rRNA (cytosine(967)-C(5))-methyltransferase RsmB [Butyrivibrio sp. MC2013]|uniref:16S rRNA (cytosine(967)-C(5))-methyltransferase RsmB n=1 Tax=Butyrivibrio sp. MC2013 TaxID=1280686 RepID=UPI00041A9AE6|nr:16S rRNA (cytosine(967)-C(5))-methyltransferase RsmB [Butyrivibrio sp. MC2013]